MAGSMSFLGGKFEEVVVTKADSVIESKLGVQLFRIDFFYPYDYVFSLF